MKGIIEGSSAPSGADRHYATEFDAATLLEGLEECLANIQPNGSFALFEVSTNAPNPGLYLKNGGGIGLPLSHRDAQAIVAASHHAPFGKGEETIIDVSVRKTWEISPGDFEIRNPAWQPYLDSIVTKVSASLGVDAKGRGVTAELYKLLLYEEGAMFKPHQDSEKAPRMFATLVIALPSKHDGGEVRVTHAGKTHIFETSKSSEFDCSYLSWFADVTHEVKPVRSGRRLVLTYNLIHTTLSGKELGSNTNKGMAKLRLLFSAWKDNIDKDPALPAYLGFLFDHQYTDASLCYNNLKGHDQEVASHLREVCEEFGFSFYLASLEREVEGGCDEEDHWASDIHEIIDEIDTRTYLKRVVDLDGSETTRNLDFPEDLFIQSDPFEKMAPDEEDYSGYTGNEGVSTTHFYHRTVAVLVPKSRRMEFLLAPSKVEPAHNYWGQEKKTDDLKVVEEINRLTNKLSGHSEDENARDDLGQICKMVIRQTKAFQSRPPPAQSWQVKPAPFSDEVITRIVATTLELDDKALFIDAYDICSRKISVALFPSVGSALVRYNLKSIFPQLSSQLALMSNFSHRLSVTKELRAAVEAEAKSLSRDPSTYLDWLNSEVNLAISSMAMISAEDALTLVDISKKLPAQDIFDKILPAVKRNANHTIMGITFLSELYEASEAGVIPQNVAHTVFKDVVSDIAPQLSLQFFSRDTLSWDSNKRVATSLAQPRTLQPADPLGTEDPKTSSRLAKLLCILLSLGLESELAQVISRIVREAVNIHVNVFGAIYLPLLKLLSKEIGERQISILGSPFQLLYQQLLSTYIVRYVQDEPEPPKDWTRPTVTCTCSDCRELNAFLNNPVEGIGRFTWVQKRRKHLEDRLRYDPNIRTETDKRGSPQTLVVIKTKAQYHTAHKAWSLRRNAAKNHLHTIGEAFLKPCLADIFYPVMSLSVSKLKSVLETIGETKLESSLTETGNSANRILSPITKRKVPAEIVVLDD